MVLFSPKHVCHVESWFDLITYADATMKIASNALTTKANGTKGWGGTPKRVTPLADMK
jgi:hypothetical protein